MHLLLTNLKNFRFLNVHLHPANAPKNVFITNKKFTANPLLVVRYFKLFYSSFKTLGGVTLVIINYCHQSLLMVVEVYLNDPVFFLCNYDFYSVYLLSRVKGVTLIGVPGNCFDRLPIFEVEANETHLIPNPWDGEISEIFNTFFDKFCPVWNW